MDLAPCSILLIEDNPADAELIKRILEKSTLNLSVQLVQDGVEAIRFLNKEAPYQQAIAPDLILLDINIPRKDGREVLCEVKQDDRFKDTPIIILTSSDNESDISFAYDQGANCYVTKPIGLKEFTKSIQLIEQFWLNMARLPGKR